MTGEEVCGRWDAATVDTAVAVAYGANDGADVVRGREDGVSSSDDALSSGSGIVCGADVDGGAEEGRVEDEIEIDDEEGGAGCWLCSDCGGILPPGKVDILERAMSRID